MLNLKDAQNSWYLYQHNVFKGIRPGEVFVDVGAYDGDTVQLTLDENPDVNFTTVAIEPEPSNFDKLKGRFKNNPLVTCVEKACWFHRGNKLLYYFNVPSFAPYAGTSLFSEGCYDAPLSPLSNAPVTVAVDTLDNILNDLGIPVADYIKIDVEGAEAEVLEGFTKYRDKTTFHIEIHKVANIPKVVWSLEKKGAAVIAFNGYGIVPYPSTDMITVFGWFRR